MVDGQVAPRAIGTILSISRPITNWNCSDLNTGWALFQTTYPVQPLFGSNPAVWEFTVKFNQFHNDGMGFTLGYSPDAIR